MKTIIKLSSVILVLLIIISVIIINRNLDKKNNYIQEDTIDNNEMEFDDYSDSRFLEEYGLTGLTHEEKERIIGWEYKGFYDVVLLMCKKNSDWSKLPISKETREKYNEKDGLLKDFDFDTVEIDYEGTEQFDYEPTPAKLIITKGKEKTRIYLDYSNLNGVSDVQIKDVVKLTDKNGNELNPGFPFDDEHIISNFSDWYNVGLTNKFKNKYGDNLLNLFIHYSPLTYNHIGFDIDKSDLSKNMAYFTVNSVLECKKREYEVYYTLDKDKYLDDAQARLVNEIDTEPNDKNSTTKAFYKHSNLQNTNLSSAFIDSISKNGSYNPDIDYIDINYFADEECLDKNYLDYIRCYKMKDGSINSYHVEYVKNGDIFDNIISSKLPYTNMSAKEVKELYLKEQNE